MQGESPGTYDSALPPAAANHPWLQMVGDVRTARRASIVIISKIGSQEATGRLDSNELRSVLSPKYIYIHIQI